MAAGLDRKPSRIAGRLLLGRRFYLDPGVPGGVQGENNLLAYFRKLQDNHRNHIDFMSTVFQFNSVELLVKTVPWVYRSYRAHGFSFDYFPLELESWKNAVKKYLDPAAAGEINAVYDWMLKHHNKMIELSAVLPDEDETFPELKDERKKFGACLLAADFRNGMKIAESILARENGQEALYLGLIKPAMYEIGRLWEQDKISIAEEHLATSMVGRILSGLYVKLPLPSPDKGKAIVTAAPNEFHELGGRILEISYIVFDFSR